MGLWIAIAVIAVIVLWFVATYNGFVKSKQVVNEAFSGMDVYLKKRYDLIPNLVETVKTYMKHEQDTLAKIVELRGAAASGATTEDKMKAEGELSQTLGRLFALAENYPELKADTQFTQLQTELTGLEADIAEARKYYNGAARLYNTKTQTMPSNLIAGIFHFEPVNYFEVSNTAERDAVKVDFSK